MRLLQTAFLPAAHRVAVIDTGTLDPCKPGFQRFGTVSYTHLGLDWGGILVEVEYQTHRIICLEHGVYVAEVPGAYPGNRSVSYTHLDVYKRQALPIPMVRTECRYFWHSAAWPP